MYVYEISLRSIITSDPSRCLIKSLKLPAALVKTFDEMNSELPELDDPDFKRKIWDSTAKYGNDGLMESCSAAM